MTRIAFVGFGEAASALVQGWGVGRHDVSSYDIKVDDSATRDELLDRCKQLEVAGKDSFKDAVESAELVFSTVTADQSLNAAKSAAPYLQSGSYWFDLNSCAPTSKQAAAEVIEQVGVHYVDVAVMAPVHPALNKVPVLLGGPHAKAALPRLDDLLTNTKLIDGPVGAASSIKMLRSVMVKGLEALTAECALAAVAAGVDEDVFASLNRSHPGSEWSAQAAYNFERSVLHGERRAAEMEEVAKTVKDLGLPNDMTLATVLWQRKLGNLGVCLTDDMVASGANSVASVLLSHVRK